MHLRPWALALAVLIPVIPAAATTPEAPWPSPARLKADIEYLASDALEGRFPGTRGCEQAAGYIAAQMEAAGLEPGGDDGTYFDGFSFTSGVDLGSGNAARLDAGGLLSQLEVNEDFVPLFFSPNGIAAGPVVFAGYGISAEEFAYDDYAGLDVAGKVVLVLRHEPGVDDPASPFKGKGMTRYADLRTKAIRARLAGAVALLAVTGPASPGAKNDTLMELRQADGYGEVGIPVVNLTRRAADLLLSTVGQTVSNLQQTIDTSYSPASLDLPGTTAELQVDLERVATQTANVVGVLSGTDPAMAHQLVIVGAHYDHLGMGQTGSLHTGPAAIHNGADDNASGVAGVLELARHFAGDRPKRSIAFVAFSAEELGLLGSAHFVKEGPLPLQGAVAMFNMDMIGRLAANDTLIVQGTGTAPEWGALLDTAVEGLPIAINRTEDGVGPSDQTSFVAQRIPVLSFFTGAHDDYHRPSDDADKINYPGEVAILTLVSRVLGAVSRGEASPTYTEVAGGTDPHQGGVDTSRGFNVYLGTIPDYSVSDKLILQGVREGGPGWEAGLRAGDQLTRFGDIEINNVYDYTYALQTYQPGDIVDVLVKRGEETLTITMTLRSKGEGEASASGAHGDPHSNPQGAGGQPGDDAHGHGEGESGEDEGTTPHGHHHHDSAVVM